MGTVLHSSFIILHLRQQHKGLSQLPGGQLCLVQGVSGGSDLDEEGLGAQMLVVAVFRQGQAAADPGVFLFQQDL